jgi:hypothetical protein
LARQLGDAVNYENLFQAADEDKRAKELMKLLAVAGMDHADLSDAALMDTIKAVLGNFDPNKAMSSEDHAFTAQMAKFQ